jgi:hypothetical protein
MRRPINVVICLLLLGLGTAGDARGEAADTVQDLLTERWYEVEFFVFERSAVLEFNSRERLVRAHPHRYPDALTAYLEPGEAIGAAYSLDPETRLCLTFPTLEVRAVPEEATGAGEPLPAGDAEGAGAPAAPSPQAPPETATTLPETAPPAAAPDPDQALREAVAGFETSLAERSNLWQPADTFVLRTEARRLERSGQGRILFHGRWLQAVPPREAAEPVLVTGGVGFDGVRELMGSAAVTVGRYLHFQVALNYTAPELGATPAVLAMRGDGGIELVNPALPPRGYMTMVQSRRMRSEELHYLDHPKLGVIVRIDPVAIPQSLLTLAEALEEPVE